MVEWLDANAMDPKPNENAMTMERIIPACQYIYHEGYLFLLKLEMDHPQMHRDFHRMLVKYLRKLGFVPYEGPPIRSENGYTNAD